MATLTIAINSTKERTRLENLMTSVVFGNHSATRALLADREQIRAFYCGVLGGEITRAGDRKDDFRIGGNFFIAMLYEDPGIALDEDDYLRATYLELKANDVDTMRASIIAFGVKVLDNPDAHLYFQAPGGQVFRLVGIDEDLSKYEGTEHGEQFVGRLFSTREPA